MSSARTVVNDRLLFREAVPRFPLLAFLGQDVAGPIAAGECFGQCRAGMGRAVDDVPFFPALLR